jgi:hypothetical protein
MGKRVNFIAQGPQAIIQMFGKLPVTLHPTNSSPEKKMFVMDAFQLPMGNGVVLIATIHGEFNDVEINKCRSFSRTFTLIPAQQGSR